MSRLLRAFVAELRCAGDRQVRTRAATAHAFEAFVQKPGQCKPCDLATAATLLAKRPADARGILGSADSAALDDILQVLADIALPQLAAFEPVDATELIHALSRAKQVAIRRSIAMHASLLRPKLQQLDARCLALVINSMARLELADRDFLLIAARRSVDVLPTGDGREATSLAHSFAKLRHYHHGLFTALKLRIHVLSAELGAPEVAQSLFAFARSLPTNAADTNYAFDKGRGFGVVNLALLERLEVIMSDTAWRNKVQEDTVLLTLSALALLRHRDCALLEKLLSSVCWSSLGPTALVTALHAASTLDAGKFIRARALFDCPAMVRASPDQHSLLSHSLSLLLYAGSHRGQAWAPSVLKSLQLISGGTRSSGPLPHLAFACLPVIDWELSCISASTDVLRVLRLLSSFARSGRNTSHQSITESGLQAEVDLSIRRISIADSITIAVESEVRAIPFWIDLVVHA